MQDELLEAKLSAVLFAQYIARGFAVGLTGDAVQKLAERYARSSGGVPVCRYWKGDEVSGPREEAREPRQ